LIEGWSGRRGDVELNLTKNGNHSLPKFGITKIKTSIKRPEKPEYFTSCGNYGLPKFGIGSVELISTNQTNV
jgi:hypothetical protein